MKPDLKNSLIRIIRQEIQRLTDPLIPSCRWFLFGSFVTDKVVPGDIDLLVICRGAEECEIIRKEMRAICGQFPIHLLIMTEVEEAELGFIQGEGAIEITQNVRISLGGI